jgi:hypothetical protein
MKPEKKNCPSKKKIIKIGRPTSSYHKNGEITGYTILLILGTKLILHHMVVKILILSFALSHFFYWKKYLDSKWCDIACFYVLRKYMNSVKHVNSKVALLNEISGSHDDCLLGYSLPWWRGSPRLWNVGLFQWDYMVLYPRRLSSSALLSLVTLKLKIIST